MPLAYPYYLIFKERQLPDSQSLLRNFKSAGQPERALPPPLTGATIPPFTSASHVTQNPPPEADPEVLDENCDASRKSSQACSPKQRLESAVETDRVLTHALKDAEAGSDAGAAGAAAAGGSGGGAPALSGDEPAP